jgi:hypothetical protein
MHPLMNNPMLFFVLSITVLWIAAILGTVLRSGRWRLPEDEREDFGLVVTASLTLLGLIIGFTFSMAMTRYDQRKNYEEAEANAIGTEYLRADLLPAADGENLRALMRGYLDQRILFYETRDQNALRQIDAATAQLQTEMWSAVHIPAGGQQTPVLALTVSGMNDVLNSQGYTRAAWWNRIPPGAWFLMACVAIFSNLLVGFDSHSAGSKASRLLVLPLVLCIAFYAIADMDSPRRGVIRVHAQNLENLSQSLHAH